MSFCFPTLDDEGLDDITVAINNVSETQELCAKMAVAASNSATWKAARTLVARRGPVGPDGEPLVMPTEPQAEPAEDDTVQ